MIRRYNWSVGYFIFSKSVTNPDWGWRFSHVSITNFMIIIRLYNNNGRVKKKKERKKHVSDSLPHW